jgi:hypothetical protein
LKELTTDKQATDKQTTDKRQADKWNNRKKKLIVLKTGGDYLRTQL